MVSSSTEKLTSLPSFLVRFSTLFFAGTVWKERIFETSVALVECNTGVSFLWLSLVCTVCVVLSLVWVVVSSVSVIFLVRFLGVMRYSVGSMYISGHRGL